MKKIVLDTNCLLMSLPKISPYRGLWDSFLKGEFVLCISNEIVEEYLEILSKKVGSQIANNIIQLIINRTNVEFVNPTYRFGLIQTDADDNKFVDCAIVAGAICIVSNDAHFKELAKIPFPKVTVFNIIEFITILHNWKNNLLN